MKYIKNKHIIEPNTGSIEFEGKVILNPTIHLLLDAGYTEYVVPEYIKTIDDYKSDKIAELYGYDKSSEVNIFYYQNIPMWLPLEQRNNLLNNSIPACEKAGAKTIYLSLGDISADFPIELAKEMLLKVEYYAKLAFDVTDKHKRAIQALMTAEEIESYDFTVGYPEKVRFETL